MAATLHKLVGASTTFLITWTRVLKGKSTGLGDLVNDAQASVAPTRTALWGFHAPFGEFWRYIPFLVWTPPPALVPAKSNIISARLRPFVVGRGGIAWNQTTLPTPGGARLRPHRLLRPATSAATALTIDGTIPWGNGYLPQPGFDYDPVPEDEFAITRTVDQAIVDSGLYYDGISFNVRRALQDSIDEGSPLRLIFPVVDRPLADVYLYDFDQPSHADFLSGRHMYLDLEWLPPNVVRRSAALPGRPMDLTHVVDNASALPRDHVQVPPTDRGEVSQWEKKWVQRENLRGPARDLVLKAAVSEFLPVNNAHSVSGKLLLSIDAYNKASGQLTPTAYWRVQAIDPDTYSLLRTINGVMLWWNVSQEAAAGDVQSLLEGHKGGISLCAASADGASNQPNCAGSRPANARTSSSGPVRSTRCTSGVARAAMPRSSAAVHRR